MMKFIPSGALGHCPSPSHVGKMEPSLWLSSLHTAHDKLLWICCRSVNLVTTLSNMM